MSYPPTEFFERALPIQSRYATDYNRVSVVLYEEGILHAEGLYKLAVGEGCTRNDASLLETQVCIVTLYWRWCRAVEDSILCPLAGVFAAPSAEGAGRAAPLVRLVLVS